MRSTNSSSAYQMVFGSNPVGKFGRGDEDGDLPFAQDTSLSGRFVARWGLRMLAQEAALEEIANSKLRRILAFNNSFDSADLRVVDEVPFLRLRPGRAPAVGGGPRGYFFWMELALRCPIKGKLLR